ncbi:MAG: hypothetical protein ACKV2V_24905 [Blastocatellia bacterium]
MKLSVHGLSIVVCALAMTVLCAMSAGAKVTRIVIEQKQSPAFDGKSFGPAGPDEILMGKASGELDPHNTTIR